MPRGKNNSQERSFVAWDVSTDSPGRVVDQRVLEQREEDERDAQVGPDVDGLGVGHRRQGLVDGRGRRRHGEQGGHSQAHAGWSLE